MPVPQRASTDEIEQCVWPRRICSLRVHAAFIQPRGELMKNVLSRALLFLALSSVAAEAQDVERFRQFAEVGVFDFEVSADQANEMVRAGIVSDDPEIVDLTIVNAK